MLVRHVSIKPSASGFGQYDTLPGDEIYDDIDFLNDSYSSGEIYELGADDLPDWVIDIRGNIHNEPQRVFVIRDNNQEHVSYFGFESAE